MKRLDLVGKIFGRLKVVSFSHTDPTKKQTMWLCHCSCGKTATVRGSHLADGGVSSCGCLVGRKGLDSPLSTGFGKIPGHRWCQFKQSAKSRGIEFSITIEYAWKLFTEQGGRCALSGVPIEFSSQSEFMTASPDRINPDLGYIPGNVQWVHKDLNIMKHTMQNDEFLKWCEIITEYHREIGVRK